AAADAVEASFAPLRVDQDDEAISIHGDGFSVRIDSVTGQLTTSANGLNVIEDGPTLVVRRSGWTGHIPGRHDVVNVPANWSASSVSIETRDSEAAVVRVRGAYDQAEGEFRYAFQPDGRLTIDYDFTWTAQEGLDPQQTYEVGLSLGVPRTLDRLTWRRDGLWTVYPEGHIGRPVGDTLAQGDPAWANLRDSVADGQRKPWPQSPDLMDGLTRDFRSTKTRVYESGLTDSAGNGLRLVSDGSQHVRVSPHDTQTGRFAFHVLDFYRGGTELHVVKSIHAGRFPVETGTELSGRVQLQLIDR
ncbi:MAG: hypothetical protein AAGH92_09265, partial [Planctomycetota bacterium]